MSDYKQTREAAGNVTSQYSQMLRNLDDDLVKRLRESGSRSEIELHEDREEAADRIEELGVAYVQADHIAELEAKLAKAMGFIQNSALRAMIEEHDEDERDMIDFDSLRFERDCDIVQARTIIAELKGETDE